MTDGDHYEQFAEEMQPMIHQVDEETGELEFSGTAPSWADLAAAFELHECTGGALDDAKEDVKRLKLKHDEATTALARLGRRVRRSNLR